MKKIILLLICLFNVFSSYSTNIIYHQNIEEGFIAGTLVKTFEGYKPIEQLNVHDHIIGQSDNEKLILNISKNVIDSCIKITLEDNVIIYAAPHQKLYLTQENKWIDAQDVTTSNIILKRNNQQCVVIETEKIDQAMDCYALTVQGHIFYINSNEILVHNAAPAAALIFTLAAANPVGAAECRIYCRSYWICII